MKVLVYSARNFEIPYLENANMKRHQMTFVKEALSSNTTIKAIGYEAISIFSGDEASFVTIEKLKDFGVKYIALRSVGFDNVNLRAAARHGIKVANVPAYSPHAIAEHAVALLLAINRKLIESNERAKRFNFNIDHLIGFDLNGKTVGIVGTGRIGAVMVKIIHGFGCHILAHDITANKGLVENYDVQYTNLKDLCERSDIISLHVPLNADTHYLIDETLIEDMKPGVILINTARGAVLNTEHVLVGIENKTIGALGMDVYEHERGVFFEDLSHNIPKDELLMKLIALPNVLITSHHAFLTEEALSNIAEVTLYNLNCWQANKKTENELTTRFEANLEQ